MKGKMQDMEMDGAPSKLNLWKGFWEGLFPSEGAEKHKSQLGTAGWLRAGVLGANDAIVSVASVMVRFDSIQFNSDPKSSNLELN